MELFNNIIGLIVFTTIFILQIGGTMTLEEKQKLHAQLVFVHQRLTQTSQYFLEEFEIAKDSIKTITDMANKLSDEIKAELESKNETEKA